MKLTLEEWIRALEEAPSPEARAALIREHAPQQDSPAAAIQARLVALLYSDPAAARRMQQAGFEYAALTPQDAFAQAYALRGAAHIAYAEGSHSQAADLYGLAVQAFSGLAALGHQGAASECARTRSSGLQSLILLSRYDQAHEWAQLAEQTFLRTGDVLRLARLDSNVGNIYFRQDRAQEAVLRYRRALEGFRASGEPKDIAAVLSNLAVAYTNLGDFQEALAAHNEAREACDQHNLKPLAAQTDYNIAYLYFLRGDYPEARRRYQISREHCEQTGDAYHLALCDLDEAEMCLELNLTHEGEALARRAAARFDDLGMRYERAKALVSLAVAGSQRGEFRNPDRVLCHARELFAAERNEVWPALIDLLRAVLAYHARRYEAATQLSGIAWRTLAHTSMPGRAAHCQILRGRLWLREGLADRARATAREALTRLGADAPPSLRFHAKLLEGEAEEMQGRWMQAKVCYEAARAEIEDLRGRLDTEDLRISLLKDKLAVYEGLISLYLESPLSAEPGAVETAWMLVQQAKSRSLADRLLRPADVSAGHEEPRVRRLREDLNWCYRQMELAQLMQRAGNPSSPVSELKNKARALEQELVRLRADGRHGAASASLLDPAVSSAEIRAAIPDGSVLLEYFESRGRLYLFLLTRDQLRLVRLGAMHEVRHSIKLLQFQLGKYRTSPAAQQSSQGLAAVRHHLETLQRLLLGGACDDLCQHQRWVIAPHRQLHAVPFSALERADGTCVIERVEIVYTPSASVYAACRKRPAPASDATHAWVLAAPDSRSPQIETEAAQVASLIPRSILVTGSTATVSAFRRAAASCSLLHLAAHGVFRRDNPMFSSLQLADGRLSLYDLAQTRLDAGLVVLSACNTGSTVSVGDELLGLMRGFLGAGARNLLVSLWEVNDRTTSEFMIAFYRELARPGATPASALRLAAAEIRQRHPHPYFWAPFILVGA